MDHRTQSGVSMIEVLTALVIIMIGLMGLSGLNLRAQQAEMESYQRVQALIVLQDMVDRVNANRKVASCYSTGSSYLGTGTGLTPSCTAGTLEQQARATSDMTDWSNLLKGTSEKVGTTNLGAMIDARGCLVYNSAATPPTVTVSVVWQGLSPTAAPAAIGCGLNLYSAETLRRGVSTVIRFATL